METRAFWLMVLGAAWALAWAGSFAVFLVPGAGGEGLVRGVSPEMAFLGWQGVAGMLAFAVLGAGRTWPPRHPIRRASGIPLALAGALAVGLGAAVLWGGFPA